MPSDDLLVDLSPADLDLAHHLSRRMHTETDGLEASAGLGPAVRRRGDRLNRTRRAAKAAPVLLAAAAVTVAVTQLVVSPRHPGSRVVAGSGPTTTTVQPRTLTVAYVLARLDAAAANLNDYIQVDDSTPTAGVLDRRLRDAATGRTLFESRHADGRRMMSLLITEAPNGTAQVLVVDHEQRAWWTRTDPALQPPSSAETPSSEGAAMDRMLAAAGSDEPRAILAAVHAGDLTVVGPEAVHGVQTVHVRASVTVDGFTISIDTWVDATTYLPVRRVVHKGPSTASLDFSWWPRSASNLSRFDLTAPAGRRSMPSVATDPT